MTILSQKNVFPDEPSVRPVLENLQGNILKGHGRDRTVHVFFQFKPDCDGEQRRSLIKALGHRVTSAWAQEEQRQSYKQENAAETTFCNIFLSARGYVGLGFSLSQLARAFPEAGVAPIAPQVAFKKGMGFYREALNDPPLSTWEPGYARDASDPEMRTVIDGMVLLANDSASLLQTEEDAMKLLLSSCATIVAVEYGEALFNHERSQNLEHFGYVDGRSQPTFYADQHAAERAKGGVNEWDPAEPLGLVLVPDLLAPPEKSPTAFGSYMVFRKLEQNVRGFKTREKELAEALGLSGVEQELAGAMVVGRFEDGTPVALQSAPGNSATVSNDFRFDRRDPRGQKCPFHAHVRKMSPRGDTLTAGKVAASSEEVERSHRIARRGITYGKREIGPRDASNLDQLPTGGVGLLFMCFQSHIDNQFAFLQRAWANNPAFPRPLFVSADAAQTGLDPVIGQSAGAATVEQHWPTGWGSSKTTSFSFENFVTLRGGEFFFAPSLPFFETL